MGLPNNGAGGLAIGAPHSRTYPVSPAQPASPPVASAQAQLESELAQLHEAIGMLDQRLQPVLGPCKPSDPTGKGPEATPTVANRIYSAASSVRIARDRVGDLLDRLEV